MAYRWSVCSKDTTFEFERKRNRPERYDRNVVEQTLKAMKKIDEVRIARESKFWERRFVLSPINLWLLLLAVASMLC